MDWTMACSTQRKTIPPMTKVNTFNYHFLRHCGTFGRLKLRFWPTNTVMIIVLHFMFLDTYVLSPLIDII